MTVQETAIIAALTELARLHGFGLVPLETTSPPPAPKTESAVDSWPGERVKAVRVALGLSQAQLAQRVGMEGAHANVAVSKIESGDRQMPHRCHAALDALEIEARRKVKAQAPPQGPVGNGPVAPRPEGAQLRRRQACGCEQQVDPSHPAAPGIPLRQCQAHAAQSKYRPQPPRTEPRAEKPPTVPLPRGGGGPGQQRCRCGCVLKDHAGANGRCWVCGKGDGRGCQRFTPETGETHAAAPS